MRFVDSVEGGGGIHSPFIRFNRICEYRVITEFEGTYFCQVGNSMNFPELDE